MSAKLKIYLFKFFWILKLKFLEKLFHKAFDSLYVEKWKSKYHFSVLSIFYFSFYHVSIFILLVIETTRKQCSFCISYNYVKIPKLFSTEMPCYNAMHAKLLSDKFSKFSNFLKKHSSRRARFNRSSAIKILHLN